MEQQSIKLFRFIICLSTICSILVWSNVHATSVPILNGPSIFSDSNGATWSGNDLIMTIDPGVVLNPFAQVGTDFPERKTGKDQLDSFGNRLLPENIIGISFDVDFDTSLYLWGFHITGYQGTAVVDNGTIAVGNNAFPPSGVNQSAYIDKINDPTQSNLHLMPVDTNSTIILSFDFEFFRSSDRYFFQFKTNHSGIFTPISLTFSNVEWITQDATAPIPEPSTIILLSLGLAGLGFVRRQRFLS